MINTVFVYFCRSKQGRKEHVSYSQTKYFYLVLRMPIALKYLKSKKGTNKVMYLFGDSLFNQITKKKNPICRRNRLFHQLTGIITNLQL